MAGGVEIAVIDGKGSVVGKKAVPFIESKQSDQLLYQAVRWQRAKKRAGTHTTKTRAQAAGGGAKPWRQKGTGRARAGSNTSPVWVGGGVAHGPKQRDYSFRMNKKERKKALAFALSARHAEGCLLLVEDLGIEEIKTKSALAALNRMGVPEGATLLIVLAEPNDVVEKSLRNLPTVKTIQAGALNVYDVLNHQAVMLVGQALEVVSQKVLN